MEPQRVVIVGAGIIGATMAYYLSRRALAVTVLERHQPCAGASGHSFAWLNAFGKEPEAYHTLNRRSMDAWHRFARALGSDIGLHWGGELRWVCNAQDAIALEQRIRQLQAWGYPNYLISPEELARLEPGLLPGTICAAAFGPIDGQVDPLKVIHACLQQARSRHATVATNTAVTGMRLCADGQGKQRVQAVYTSQGEVPCDVLVLAGGTETTALAAMAGIALPQQESPGVVMRTDPRPRILHNVAVLHTPPIDAERPEIHIRQLADGTLQIGEGTQESLSRNDSQEHANDLLARATHYLPALAGARALPVPVGYRPMPVDGLPVVGFTKAVPNLYISLMHSGVTLAPLVGEMATIEIVDTTPVALLENYRPDRFHAMRH